MDDNTTLLIIGALVAVVIIALIAGRRLSSAGFNVGKLFGANVKTHAPTKGATISKATVSGKEHEVRAQGKGSIVQDIDVKGSNSKIIAEE